MSKVFEKLIETTVKIDFPELFFAQYISLCRCTEGSGSSKKQRNKVWYGIWCQYQIIKSDASSRKLEEKKNPYMPISINHCLHSM